MKKILYKFKEIPDDSPMKWIPGVTWVIDADNRYGWYENCYRVGSFQDKNRTHLSVLYTDEPTGIFETKYLKMIKPNLPKYKYLK